MMEDIMKTRWTLLVGGVALGLSLGSQGAFARDAQTDINRLDAQLAQMPAGTLRQGYSPNYSAAQLSDDAEAALVQGNTVEADRMARLGLHELSDGGGVAVSANDEQIPYQVSSGAWGMVSGIPADQLTHGAGPGPQLYLDGQTSRPAE
jgi:hypothetical protein